LRLAHTIGDTVWTFRDLKDVLAKASPLRSGDVLAGISATSSEERVAARMRLAIARRPGAFGACCRRIRFCPFR
jgi:ethanolamine ammonia-lyase large subunit